MRNLEQYPITEQEVVDYLIQLQEDSIQQNNEQKVIGDMSPLLIQTAIDIIEKYLKMRDVV